MALLYRNISGSTGVNVQLLSTNVVDGGIRSISIANTGSAGTISLFLQPQDASGESGINNTFFLIRGVSVPSGVTLLLDDANMLRYDTSKYTLGAIIGSGDSFSIKIS
tara:strand:- start:234 stop:557 length:324 start_codon:yes stop_codon:yes gene_type:complete